MNQYFFNQQDYSGFSSYKSDSDCKKILEEVEREGLASKKLKSLEKWIAFDNKYLLEYYIAPIIGSFSMGSDKVKAAAVISKYVYNLSGKSVHSALETCSFGADQLKVLESLSKSNNFDISDVLLICEAFKFSSDKAKAEKIIKANKK